MSSRDRIAALTRAEIRTHRALLGMGDTEAWIAAVRASIVTGYHAATWAAIEERDRQGWLRRRAAVLYGDVTMSRHDRDAMRAAITHQLRFFERFAREVRAGRLSPAQIAARADLYALATRTVYDALRWGDWDIPAWLLPGNQACRGRCRCTISVRDAGDGTGVLTRVLNGERHCLECPPLQGEHLVYRRRR